MSAFGNRGCQGNRGANPCRRADKMNGKSYNQFPTPRTRKLKKKFWKRKTRRFLKRNFDKI